MSRSYSDNANKGAARFIRLNSSALITMTHKSKCPMTRAGIRPRRSHLHTGGHVAGGAEIGEADVAAVAAAVLVGPVVPAVGRLVAGTRLVQQPLQQGLEVGLAAASQLHQQVVARRARVNRLALGEEPLLRRGQ